MLTPEVKSIIKLLQEYFATKPVVKVWLFGSCSRGEETDKSDIDIIVQYDSNVKVGLLMIGGIYMDLKALLGREIDLVEEGTLLPFAQESAENDKILIYERAA